MFDWGIFTLKDNVTTSAYPICRSTFAFSVVLQQGCCIDEGNVYALNPRTGIFGPVCDDGWDMNSVCGFF